MVIVRKVINMSYKTNLTHDKREQLKSQMDDFATFQWRGHDMWEEYGCFIINESKSSLKFYNGPGYSNKYAKPQFSSSVNTLIGVDFKQKTIPMKIGMYWFTIEEYQEFLNEIGPYVINYLTFGYEKNYGYLVKLANIADSPRHVIGTNEDGDYVYYTEMDLTWELLGDNCVRSNLPYEYKRKENEVAENEYTWELDNTYSDMKDPSQLDTPLMLEIPLRFTNNSATIKLQAINSVDYLLNDDGEIEPVVRTTPVIKELFNIQLKDLTHSTISYYLEPGKYKLNSNFPVSSLLWNHSYGLIPPTEMLIPLNGSDLSGLHESSSFNSTQIDIVFSSGFTYLFIPNCKTDKLLTLSENTVQNENEETYTLSLVDNRLKLTITPKNGNTLDTTKTLQLIIYCARSKVGNLLNKTDILNTEGCYSTKINYNDVSYNYITAARSTNSPFGDPQYLLISSDSSFDETDPDNTTKSRFSPQEITLNSEIDIVEYISTTSEQLEKGFTLIEGNKTLWTQYVNIYQMLLRYDSETGLLYIQEGDNDTWHLLNYQTNNSNGDYILQSAVVNKWKMPGSFSVPFQKTTDWQFKLTTTNVDLSLIPQQILNTSITAYARKNIV